MLAEQLLPEPSPLEVETATASLKKYMLRGCDQILADLTEVRKICLINGRSLVWYKFTRTVIKWTVVSIEGYHYCQLHAKFYLISFIKNQSRKCGFRHNRSTTDHIFSIRQTLDKKGTTMRHYLICSDFKKAYDSVSFAFLRCLIHSG
jgi:hypothetical protein